MIIILFYYLCGEPTAGGVTTAGVAWLPTGTEAFYGVQLLHYSLPHRTPAVSVT